MRALMMTKKAGWLPALCFTADQANSTVALNKLGTPAEVTLEISTDGKTWSDYTFAGNGDGTTLNLTNVWDKVYMRNKSENATSFSTSTNNRYQFDISWQVRCSWDVTYLLCKNGTDTLLGGYCFTYLFFQCLWLITAPSLPATTLTGSCYQRMFYGCTNLTTAPSLPATTLIDYCYAYMFYSCENLITLPQLPATTLPIQCYYQMFRYCSKIKLSAYQDSDYTQAYRIPTEWTWTEWSNSVYRMFTSTWWTWGSSPQINTTYYLHKDNTIV